ncbi:MAG: KH domain-containing protein [Clostridia bacterium]|nr:KH domain-containing protein [Clostridia bacterium]
MRKEVTITAETIEEAEEKARKELQSEEIQVEVVQQPEKKKLFFGGKPAIIKAYIELTPLESAKNYLTEILYKLGIEDFTLTAEEVEGGAIINIDGEDVGFIIGHRGETLDALQYLTGLIANHVDNEYYRISINIGNYREKREKTLEILGRKLAFKAFKTGVKTSLEPMNPYERRIIHTAVQKVRGATSWSEGENLQRHVVIGPDPDYKPNYRDKGGYRGRRTSNFNKDGSYNRKPRTNGYQRRQYSENESHPQDSMFSTFENDSESAKVRASINERPDTSLYGKVEIKKPSDESFNS